MVKEKDALAPEPGEGFEDDGARKLVRDGMFIVALVLGGLLVWSVFTRLDSAIIAIGEVSVEGNAKAIQHLEGGIVAEVLVREGDPVSVGDLLIRLDDTAIQARATQTVSRLTTLLTERDRLRAERDNADEIVFSDELTGLGSASHLAEQKNGQRDLFNARRASRLSQIRIERQKMSQLRERITGLEEQQISLQRQFEFLQEERDAFVRLGDNSPKLRIVQVDREGEALKERMARIRGEMAAQLEALAEASLVISQMTDGFQEEVETELRKRESEISEVRQGHIAAQDELRRTEIRSPHAGRVLGLVIHNPGAVIRAGEELMRVVPAGEKLIVRSQVRPQDVDRVIEGQAARLVFSSIGGRSSPQVEARVLSVSADVLKDQATQVSFYIATLSFDVDDPELGGFILTPGMPVEAFIRTEGQTVLSYLTRPLTDSLGRTFIEE